MKNIERVAFLVALSLCVLILVPVVSASHDTQEKQVKCDINKDHYVNAKEATLLGAHFGENRQIHQYDLFKDHVINAKDAVVLGSHFGEST